MDAVQQADARQRRVHQSLALRRCDSAVDQRQLDVAIDVEVPDQVEGLEDEADRAAPDLGALRWRKGRDRLPRQDIAAFARRIEEAEDRKQGRLSAAGRTADRHVLARPDLEVDVRERVSLDLGGMEDLAESAQLNEGIDRQ